MTGTASMLPPGRCPARRGNGTDVTAAGFVLVVHDCGRGPDARPATTEVFGYFSLPGDEHAGDVVLTDGFEVPSGSPISQLAHQVNADPAAAGKIAAILRGAYVHLSVSDDGGAWVQRARNDGRPHGLDIVAALVVSQGGNWGVLGDAMTGWASWATLDWSGGDTADYALASPGPAGMSHCTGHFTRISGDVW